MSRAIGYAALALCLFSGSAAMAQHKTGLLFTCEATKTCKMEGTCSTHLNQQFQFAGAAADTVYLRSGGRLDVATHYAAIDAYVWKRNHAEYRLKLDRRVLDTGSGAFHLLHIEYQSGHAHRIALNEISGTCRSGW